MKKKWTPFVENIGESTAACLVAMVQGNILIIGATHWAIALQTGIIAGVVASVALLFMKTSKRWPIAIVLAVVTGVVDYLVHPGMIGTGPATEAIVTGLGAGALSLAVGSLWTRLRGGRPAAPAAS